MTSISSTLCHAVQGLEKTAITAHLQVGKGNCGSFGDFDKSCKHSDLWLPFTGNHTQRTWEKEGAGERPERSLLASSSWATSLSSWLFAQTKATDNAGAAVLTAWSWERWKAPGGRWMGQLECSCKMTVFRGRPQRLMCKHTRIFSPTLGAHEYTIPPVPIIYTVLINRRQVGLCISLLADLFGTGS